MAQWLNYFFMVNLVYGLVTEWKAGYARVKLPTYDDIVSDWWPIIKARAMNDDENWPFETDEQVACMCDEKCKTGVIIGAISNDVDVPESGAAEGKYRKYFSDGTFVEYDKAAHKMTVSITASGAEMDVIVGGDTHIVAKDKEVDIVVSGTTSAVIKDGEIDAIVNSTKLAITDGKIDAVDGSGAELSMTGGLFTIKNGSKNLKTILNDICTHIQALTVGTGTGPSTPPINVADFVTDAADVSALLS